LKFSCALQRDPPGEVAMNKRVFGRTGLEVTELAYGAMELRKMDEAQADKLLNTVLDSEINFIDTSPDYGNSEDLIGKFVSARRDEYVLASKCGCNVPDDESGHKHIWTGEQVIHNVDHSLERMKTDHLDLLQAHSGTAEEIESGGVVEAMKKVQSEGKVRFIGYTATGRDSFGYDDVQKMIAWDAFDFYQLPYNIVARPHETTIAQAGAAGAGIILRGTVKPSYARVYGDDFWETVWEKAGLDDLIEDGEDRYRFMLRYAISHPDYSTAIIGTRSLDHLADNIATFGKALSRMM
jgi:aryl-alcohol dehydrogenase-like predicted oxidoreductase